MTSLFQGEKRCEHASQSARRAISSAWAGQEDFLEEAVCGRASKNPRQQQREVSRCDKFRGVEVC